MLSIQIFINDQPYCIKFESGSCEARIVFGAYDGQD